MEPDPPPRACHDEGVTAEPEPMLVPELLVAISAEASNSGAGCAESTSGTRARTRASPISRSAPLTSCSSSSASDEIGVTGPLDVPLGRGINFQISVPNAPAIAAALGAADVRLFMEPEPKW